MVPSDYLDLDFLDHQERAMGGAYRQAAAQAMRLARGSGDPDRLVAAVVEAAKYAEVLKHAPALGLAALEQVRRWHSTKVDDSVAEEEIAIARVCDGALQLVASRLANDPSREALGRQQLADGGGPMSEGMLTAIASVAALAFAAVQFWLAQRAQARQRDAEMTHWAGDVIDMMAELETICSPIEAGKTFGTEEAEVLGYRASALVDRGRLFFPNVKKGQKRDDEGTRVKILDEVLRACYVARHVAAGASASSILREQVWSARRRFVALLQDEMGKSLRKPGKGSEREHIPTNPKSWPVPTHDLNLPLGDGPRTGQT